MPIVETFKKYTIGIGKSDFLAGLTVGVILIPQAIAYAFLAGVPPIYGLYSSLIPLIIYAFLGTSQHLSIGPVAVTSILIMAGVSQLAEPFSNEFVSLVLLVGLLVGVIQVLMGFLKLGFLVNVLAQPVISGFISAAAIIIIVSQFKSGFGITMPTNVSTFESISYLIAHILESHLPSVIITLISITLMLVLKVWKKNFPSALMLIVVFTLSSYLYDFKSMGISILGEIPDGLPSLYVPNLEWETIKALMPTVFTLTIIGYLGSIGIAKSFQMKHRNYEVNPNKELIALGFAKIIGTFFQGNLASGSYSRSAINEDAGAKTTISALATALIILMALLFLTPLLYFLPKPVLAAIILVSVFSLIKIKEARKYLNIQLDDFIIMLVTFLVTLLISIETGILSGVMLSFVFLQYKSSKPHIAELVKIPKTNYYRNLNRFPNGKSDDRYIVMRFDDQLFFGNSDYFKESVYKLIEKRKITPNYIIVNATNIHNIDSTALHMLEDLYAELEIKNIQILFAAMIGPVRDVLKRSGFMNQIGNSHQFMSIRDAVKYLDNNELSENKSENHVMQFNERRFFFFKK